MANLFDIKDARGYSVYCESSWWEKHVLTPRPFMKGWTHQVIQTIKKPDFIVQDAIHPKRNNYFRSFIHKKEGVIIQEFIKVVVEFTDPTVGNVITAFPDNNKKPKETVIWTPQKPK